MAIGQKSKLVPVQIEALGDDFALVSGQWLRGERIAAHLKRAVNVWVFAAKDANAVTQLMQSLPKAPDETAIAVSPGLHPDWPAEDVQAIGTLLGHPNGLKICGLMMTIPLPTCDCPHRNQTGGCEGCGGCNKPDE